MSPGEVQAPDPAAGGPAGGKSDSGAGEVVEEIVAGGMWVVDVRCLKLMFKYSSQKIMKSIKNIQHKQIARTKFRKTSNFEHKVNNVLPNSE